MSNTIPALKQSFLTSQVRLLNAPIKPPPNWRDTLPPSSEEIVLSEKVVSDVLERCNSVSRCVCF